MSMKSKRSSSFRNHNLDISFTNELCCNVSSRTRYKMHSHLSCCMQLRTWSKSMIYKRNVFDITCITYNSHGSKPKIVLFKTCQVTWFQVKMAQQLMANSQYRAVKTFSGKKKDQLKKTLASSFVYFIWNNLLFPLSMFL